MPTILKIEGFRIMIYHPPREHGSAHVHVWHGDSELVVMLGDEGDDPLITRNTGMGRSDLIKAYRIVQEHIVYLRAHWRKYHG